jgi:hypothetical protein
VCIEKDDLCYVHGQNTGDSLAMGELLGLFCLGMLEVEVICLP